MKSAPGLLTFFSLPFTKLIGYIVLDVPGGTENVAATKMTKTLYANATGDENDDDDQTGDGNTPSSSKPATKETKGARSEGTRNSLEAMFDSMVPLKKGNKKRTRDGDDSSDDENKRRRGGGRGGGGGNPTGEAGFGLLSF